MKNFDAIYSKLKNECSKSWMNYPLQLSGLGQLLSQDKTPNDFHFFQVFFSSWRITQEWFKSFITDNDLKLEFEHLANQYQNAKRKRNSIAPISTASPQLKPIDSKEYATNLLKNAGIDIHDNQKLIDNCGQLDQLCEAMSKLTKVKSPLHHPDSILLPKVESLLTQENFNDLVKHPNPELLAEVFLALHSTNLLTLDNKKAVFKHSNLQDLTTALRCFKSQSFIQLSPQDFFSTLTQSTINPVKLSKELILLQTHHLLTNENIKLLSNHHASNELLDVLIHLSKSNLLNQANLDRIMSPAYNILLTREALERVWKLIPAKSLTESYFNELLIESTKDNPMLKLDNMVKERHRQSLAPQFVNSSLSFLSSLSELKPTQRTRSISCH